VSLLSYDDAGVRGQEAALDAVGRYLGPTLARADVLTHFGDYAAVVRLDENLALAICTDGVGSKTLIASMLERYDTIGFDCVAMNVNDLVCVGARPTAMVDYLAVSELDPGRAEAIMRGLGAAAEAAGIAVVGGELSQLPDIIGHEDPTAFDLVGTAIGTLHPSAILRGDAMAAGDVLVGIASSGIHSNGLTLARRALLERAGGRLDEHVEALGRTLGEELLEPTAIYARPVLALWEAGVATLGLAHITGDGFRNLCRMSPRVGFVLDHLPPAPPIFGLIAAAGDIPSSEMYAVFNMGVGLVVAISEADVDAAVEIVAAHGLRAGRIGRVTDETGVVRLVQPRLVGDRRGLHPA
jgi:phosphoribosylformylglycinamidine cyclo-ligase